MNDTNGIRINNAGIIILTAFLPVYFERLGLIANGKFIAAESQNRALFLLQYLVYDTNYTKANDDNLALNKIIVGLSLDAPEQFIFTITETEKELSKSLIYAVLDKWDKVRGTTIEGLQATFFMREGLITMNQNSYTLLVKRKTLDIIMETLPWNFSLINFPWMQMPLYVEW